MRNPDEAGNARKEYWASVGGGILTKPFQTRYSQRPDTLKSGTAASLCFRGLVSAFEKSRSMILYWVQRLSAPGFDHVVFLMELHFLSTTPDIRKGSKSILHRWYHETSLPVGLLHFPIPWAESLLRFRRLGCTGPASENDPYTGGRPESGDRPGG